MGKYDDIINLERPKSSKPSMPVSDRAKIFMPFAALKGYEDAIEEKKKLTIERMELAEEKKEELDKKLQLLAGMIATNTKPEITIRHFVCDKKASKEAKKEVGNYFELCGIVSKVDVVFEQIKVMDYNIALKDVLEISGDIFDE